MTCWRQDLPKQDATGQQKLANSDILKGNILKTGQ